MTAGSRKASPAIRGARIRAQALWIRIKTAAHDPVEWYDGPGNNGTAYKKIENPVDVLHRIGRMALDGFGIRKIAAILNRDGVPDW